MSFMSGKDRYTRLNKEGVTPQKPSNSHCHEGNMPEIGVWPRECSVPGEICQADLKSCPSEDPGLLATNY